MADAIIEAFTGKLGGGKTYSAVERIFAHLLKGGVYFGNVTLNWDYVKSWAYEIGYVLDDKQYQPLTNDQIQEFYRHVIRGSDAQPVLLVIDEAHLFFNAREWSKTAKEVLTFITQTRKVSVSMIVITQHLNNLDKQFVRMIQYDWRFRDMKKWKLPALGIAWPLNQILQVCIDAQDGKTVMSRRFTSKNKRIFKCYESKALLVDLHLSDLDIKIETRKLTRKEKIINSLKRNKMPIVVLFIVMLGVGGFSAYKLHDSSQQKKAELQASLSHDVTVDTPPRTAKQLGQTEFSPYVTGYTTFGGTAYIFLMSSHDSGQWVEVPSSAVQMISGGLRVGDRDYPIRVRSNPTPEKD